MRPEPPQKRRDSQFVSSGLNTRIEYAGSCFECPKPKSVIQVFFQSCLLFSIYSFHMKIFSILKKYLTILCTCCIMGKVSPKFSYKWIPMWCLLVTANYRGWWMKNILELRFPSSSSPSASEENKIKNLQTNPGFSVVVVSKELQRDHRCGFTFQV